MHCVSAALASLLFLELFKVSLPVCICCFSLSGMFSPPQIFPCLADASHFGLSSDVISQASLKHPLSPCYSLSSLDSKLRDNKSFPSTPCDAWQMVSSL